VKPNRIEAGMRRIDFCTLALIFAAGCTRADRSPDAIRHDAAKATTTVVRDAKAVAQGVKEGLKTKGPLNLNRASADDLQSLLGMDAVHAERIVAGRPYQDSSELVKRHLVTKAEYERIADKVTTQ